MNKILIAGINEDGAEGLSRKVIDEILKADVIAGGKRHLKLLENAIQNKEKIIIGADLDSVLKDIEELFKAGKRVVVLNSGDPLFYGLAKRIIDRFGKDKCEIFPNLSSLQLAFAKIKESWEDAKLLSIHSKANKIEDFIWDILENEKIFFLTSGKDDPKIIAEFLTKNDIKVKKFYVLENIGGENERILDIAPEEAQKYDFSPLNVVIIIKEKKEREFFIGIKDEAFLRYRGEGIKSGLITRSEIRAIAISKMRLTENSLVWDIGGGSGSVSVECALLARKGKVFSIEKRQELIPIIKENARKFRAYNLEVVFGTAPQILKELPDPTAVFIGGGGEKIEEILQECLGRKSLRSIVATFVVPSHFIRAKNFLEQKNFKPEVIFLDILSLKSFAENLEKFESKTAVFILSLWIT
ncbi:Cobalamin biosynthesis bifunctional protein CbiET [bacterium HR19]|nr:Cobalamin biosynthesis bifunctional protein CbiET [bacterium HR19]